MRTPIATLATFATLAAAPALSATVISAGDFAAPAVIDFEGAALGTIAATDALFSDAGIIGITGTSETGDQLGARTGVSRSLGIDGAGNPQVIDPNGAFGLFLSATLTFADPITRFGFEFSDQYNFTMTVEFFSGGSLVDSYSQAFGLGDLFSLYLESAAAFDEVRIAAPSGGIAFDSFTVGAPAVIPLPATGATMALALGAMGWVRRKA